MATESARFILCPYCGHPQPVAERCAVCGGHFEPLSRKATQISMGPWFIRDRNVPFRPGCSFEVLRKQIDAGRIKPNTVMRGPTTHQFWSVARNVPGVAHLLGYCHECNHSVKPDDPACPKCKTKFTLPTQRNELGLLYPTAQAAANAQKSLDREIDRKLGGGSSASSSPEPQSGDTGGETRAPVQGGLDLLDQVLSVAEKRAVKAAVSQKPATPAAAPQSQAAPAGAAKPTSLDFGPAEGGDGKSRGEAGFLWTQPQQDQTQPMAAPDSSNPTAAVPKAGKTSWLIWLLVAINILVVGLLVLVVLMQQRGQG